MSKFRKFLLGFFRCCFVLTLISFLFHLSFSGFIEKGLMEILMNSDEVTGIFEEVGVSKEKVKNVMTDEVVNEFLQGLIDNFLYDFSYGEVIKNKNLVVKLKTFVIDNRKHLEDVIGYKIYDEFINEIDNITEVKEIDIKYADLISVSKEYIPSSVRSIMITIYDLSKISYNTIMIVSLVILLGIVIALHWSYYEWLKSVGTDLIGCGIFMFIVTCVVNYLMGNILINFPVQVTFDFMKVFNISMITLGIGIVIRVSHVIIEKILEKKELKSLEIS